MVYRGRVVGSQVDSESMLFNKSYISLTQKNFKFDLVQTHVDLV